MLKPIWCYVAFVSLAWIVLHATAIAQKERDELLPKEVQQLSVELDDAKQAVRDQAEARLMKLGPSILEHLPAVSEKSSDEWKMRVDRIRTQLETIESESFFEAKLVTLQGALSAEAALTQLMKQTGNEIALTGIPDLNRSIQVDFLKVPYWEAFDELLDQLELTIAGGDGAALRFASRKVEAPLRSAAGFYSGVFRIEPVLVQKSSQLSDPTLDSLRIELQVAWEPRLIPVMVKFDLNSMQIQCDDGQILKPLENGQEVEFVPTGGAQMVIPLAFDLPKREAKRIKKLSGEIAISVPGRLASVEFSDLLTAEKKSSSIGALQVVLEKARKNRDIYQVLLGVTVKSGPQTSESFRGWTNLNEAYLLTSKDVKIDNVGWSTTRMTGTEIGLSYLFDHEPGLDDCRLVYRAPAILAQQILEFELKDIPLP
jgi:hypothetical protein